MKKIFAFILASIMVLSLVPASVFAAVSVCPDVHTPDNCSNHQVGKPVPATCISAGYTAYKCDDCGADFLADIEKPLGHDWISTADDDKHKDSEGNCSKTDKPAITWVACSRCDDWKTDDTDDVDVIPCKTKNCDCGLYFVESEPAHTWVWQKGAGCEAEYKCSVCGDIAYYDSKDDKYVIGNVPTHDFKYDSTTKAPVVPTKDNHTEADGEALFKCTKCGTTRDVVIKSEHTCSWKRISGFDKGDCATAGKYAVYECELCLKKAYFTETFKDDGSVKEKKLVDLEYVDGTENVYTANVKKDGHTKDSSWTFDYATCTWTGKCTVCKKSGSTIKEHQNYIRTAYLPATCGNKGYEALFCTTCGESWLKDIDPIGAHDTFEYIVPASCGKKGAALILCKEVGCIYGVEYNDQYVGGVARQAGPDNRLNTADDIINTKYTITEEKDKGTYTVVKVVPIAVNASGHDLKKVYLNSAEKLSCGETALYRYQCKLCQEYVGDVYIETGSAHDLYVLEKWYTHVAPGVVKEHFSYRCWNCLYYYRTDGLQCRDYKNISDTNKNTVDVGTIKTLDSIIVGEKDAMVYHSGAFYYAKVDAEKKTVLEYEYIEYKVDGSTVAPTTGMSATPSCTQTGYATYACTVCSNFLVNLGKGDHPTAADKYEVVAAKAPDCSKNKDGNIAYNKCKVCGGYWNYDTTDPTKQVKLSAADVVVKKCSNTAIHYVVKDCTGKQLGEYWMCKVTSGDHKHTRYFSDAACTKSLTEAEAKAIAAKVNGADFKEDSTDAKLYVKKGCFFRTDVTAKKATCGEDGMMEVKFCETCKTLKITEKKEGYSDVIVLNEVVSSYHKENLTATTVSFLKAGQTLPTTINLVVKAHQHKGGTAISEIADLSHKEHRLCNSKDATYIYNQCSVCKHAFLTKFTEEHEHVNENGQRIWTSCGNKNVTDRFCVVDNCYYNTHAMPINNHVIDGEGNTLERLLVPANCVDEGYNYYFCTECDYKIVKSNGGYGVNKDNHKNLVEVANNYAQAGYSYCTACGYESKAATPVSEAGVEIALSAKVNGAAGDIVTYGSIIEVTATLSSLKGVDVWGVEFGLDYEADYLELVETSFNTATGDLFGLATDRYMTINERTATGPVEKTVKAGIVHVVANCEEEETFIKGNVELATFTFKVIYKADAMPINYLDFSVGEVEDATMKKYNVTVIDENGKPVNCMYGTDPDDYEFTGSVASVNFKSICDLDKVEGLSIGDAHRMYELMMNNKYNVIADVDADGDVDTEDMRLFYALLTGATSLKELFGIEEEPVVDPEEIGGGISGQPRN